METRKLNRNRKPQKKQVTALLDEIFEDSTDTIVTLKEEKTIISSGDQTNSIEMLEDGTYTVTVITDGDTTVIGQSEMVIGDGEDEYEEEEIVEEAEEDYDYDYDYDDYDGYDHYYNQDTTGWDYFRTEGYFTNEIGADTLFQNLFVADIGKGKLIIHVNPVMFSNYFLLSEDGFEYTNEVLASVDDKPVIWDRYHHTYRAPKGDYQESQTPLRFVFNNAPLKYAWLTLVASTFVFLFFRTKREQNIIPIIPVVENTSIAFAKSLGILYHQARSGRFLAIELMRMFDNYLRRHYGYNRDRKSEDGTKEIAKKSRVDGELIQKIIDLEMKIVYNPSSKITEVVTLYNHLQTFYKQAKK